MHDFLAAFWVMPTHTGTENLAIVLRWIHFLAGVLWVGLLYFFNLVNVPFMKHVDAGLKPTVLQHLTLPTLHLFRWSSVVTVFMGFWYWAHVFVGPDARLAEKSPWGTIGLFLLVWLVAFGIYFPVLMKTPNPWLLAVVVLAVVSAASWIFVKFTPVGGDDNHVLSIGIGGGIGIFMMLNVWGIIWRFQKKIIRGTLAGSPPADAALLARRIFLASRTNLYLSIPMLFFMAASSHYPLFGG
jgi:uncharacterized membrane protein